MEKIKFKSGLAPQLNAFVIYKQTTLKWDEASIYNLKKFDAYCAEKFPKARNLHEDMFEWCEEKPTEHGNSCSFRISPIREFVRFSRKMDWTKLEVPSPPSYKKRTYIPHFFSDNEKKQFFIECDEYIIRTINWRKEHSQTRVLVVPVYFRLLYSTGMRTNEARLLKCSDIDFDNGVININDSKGNDKHRVALHSSIWELLKKYHKAMSLVMPKRIYFFPDKDDKPFKRGRLEVLFAKIWKKVNEKQRAIAYNLRHNYAIENINGWKDIGYDINDKMIYLGRTMGHCKFSSTMHYFSLAPCFSNKMKDLCEDSFNKILPNGYETEN